MSATIYYQPIEKTPLEINASSSFMDALSRLCGSRSPWEFNRDVDYDMLRGLQAGMGSEDQRAAIGKLLDALIEYDSIRVWGEY